MRARDKVVIGWIDPGQVEGMFAMDIATVYASRASRIDGLLRVQAGGLLSRGRNEVAARFMEHTDAEWLLMIDSDQRLSVDGFDKLIDSVHDVERPIMGGLYFGAWPGDLYPTAMPMIFKKVPDTTRFLPVVDYPQDKVIEVDAAGTGCLMVHRSVLAAFQNADDPHGGTRWCWFRDMPVNGDWFGEDMYFCGVAKELGFRIHANTGVVLPHRKSFWLTDKHHGR